MVVITTKSGEERIYDHVVMACHADTTLKLLGEGATEQEREILGGFEFSKNEVVLHGDPAVSISHETFLSNGSNFGFPLQLMPIRRQAWSGQFCALIVLSYSVLLISSPSALNSAWNYLTSSTKSATGKLKANINEVSL